MTTCMSRMVKVGKVCCVASFSGTMLTMNGPNTNIKKRGNTVLQLFDAFGGVLLLIFVDLFWFPTEKKEGPPRYLPLRFSLVCLVFFWPRLHLEEIKK